MLLVNNYRGGPYGFPSCHSANSFALATFLTFLTRRRKLAIFIFGWAILNSYTRLYLGVHYPGDLIVGAIIGSLIGWACCRLSIYVDKNFAGNAAHSGSKDADFNRPLVTIPYGAEWAGLGRNTIAITPDGEPEILTLL